MITAHEAAGLTLDNKPLGDLKLALKKEAAQGGSGKSTLAVAKQFESMFLNLMLRGMRSSTGNTPFDNNETKLYTGLLDEQIAQKISTGRGLGLADALVKQITRSQAQTLPSHDAPAQPFPLKKEGGSQALSKSLPGAAATPLPLNRGEAQIPGGFPLSGKLIGQHFEEKLSYNLQGSLLRAVA